MQLFYLDDGGNLNAIQKLEFVNSEVYVIDDEKTVFIWVGLNTNQDKKDIAAELARKLENERPEGTKILIMKQNREYGSFLAMMDNLRTGQIPGISISRRPELELQKSSEISQSEQLIENEEIIETQLESNIKNWLKQLKKYRSSETETTSEEIDDADLESQIREGAYFLSLENYSYNDLCWLLAEKILKYTLKMPTIEDTKQKAEEIFSSSCTYDELCWLNAEMDVLAENEYLVRDLIW